MVTVCPSQFATRRTLFHVLVGCGLLMLKVSRLKLPVIWLLVSMWLKIGRAVQQECPRPISYAVFCLKKKKHRCPQSEACRQPLCPSTPRAPASPNPAQPHTRLPS